MMEHVSTGSQCVFMPPFRSLRASGYFPRIATPAANREDSQGQSQSSLRQIFATAIASGQAFPIASGAIETIRYPVTNKVALCNLIYAIYAESIGSISMKKRLVSCNKNSFNFYIVLQNNYALLELISELAPFKHRLLSGIVGWRDNQGNSEWLIIISSIHIHNKYVHFFVASPESEWYKTESKLAVMLNVFDLNIRGLNS